MNEQHAAPATATRPANGQPMIEAIGLSKYYGIFAACRDISFEIKQGEIVAFLGPNGAGKSTTMRCLSGLLRHQGHRSA